MIFKDKVIEEGEWNFEGEATAMWNQMAIYIEKVAREVLRELIWKRYYNKVTQWWSVEVQEVVQGKRCYRAWQATGNMEYYKMYKKVKKEAKKVVSGAKFKANDDTYIIGWEREKERMMFLSLQK